MSPLFLAFVFSSSICSTEGQHQDLALLSNVMDLVYDKYREETCSTLLIRSDIYSSTDHAVQILNGHANPKKYAVHKCVAIVAFCFDSFELDRCVGEARNADKELDLLGTTMREVVIVTNGSAEDFGGFLSNIVVISHEEGAVLGISND